MAAVRSSKCGRDGFPKFPEHLAPEIAAKVSAMQTRLVELKSVLKNSNETAILRACSQKTKDQLREKHSAAEVEKQQLLDNAAKLFFRVTDKQVFEESMAPMAGGGKMALDMDTMRRMCEASAAMAVTRMQAASSQNTLMLADDTVNQLNAMDRKISDLAKVKKGAVQALLDDPDEYDRALDAAAEKLLGTRREDVMKRAVDRMLDRDRDEVLEYAAKRMRLEEEEEEEEEESEDEV